MFKTLTRRQLFTWIAAIAILVNALAPSVSHAVAAWQPLAPVFEICGIGQHSGSPTKEQPAPLQDCGYCLTHAGSHGMLPGALAVAVPASGHALRPFLFYHAPQPLLALSAAAPRGPPAHA